MNKLLDRRHIVILIIFVAFGSLLFRLGELTLIDGGKYRKKADESFIKMITLSAKRGDILDRNGSLLATSQPSYSLNYIDFTKDIENQERVSIDVLKLLETQGETFIEFPINYNGEFAFSSDQEKIIWLNNNNFDLDMTAEEVFQATRNQYYIDSDLDNYTAQNILINKGVYLPLSIRNMKFLSEIDKENFLKYYDLPVTLTAEKAYEALSQKSRIKPVRMYEIEDALRIMTIKHAIKLTGYYSYKPIEIAKNIKKTTAVIIQERMLEFPGVSVSINPIRSYPFNKSTAHVLGYLGKLSSDYEVDYYVNKLDYPRDDLIGKTGIEKIFEETLHGVGGTKYVYADAKGNYIGDFLDGIDQKENVKPISGADIQLSIDIKLQQKVESLLEYTLNKINSGGEYVSEWGNMQYDTFENAKTGAVMVVDVNTGEVLALVNNPSYDPNLFSTGISINDWKALQPNNPKNPLDARPLYNIATKTSVQPGSVYKPITVLAALENGLSAEQKLYSNGYIEIGKQLFRCWYYKEYGKRHGLLTALEALMVSSNYIMFDLVSGYDYYKNETLNMTMSTETLLDYGKRFGLGSSTGIEINEAINGLPSEKIKKESIKYALRNYLEATFEDYTIISEKKDEKIKKEIINSVINWADEYVEFGLTRNEIIRRLNDYDHILEPKLIESLSDVILYSYYKQIKWRVGDNFNLSIGQGDHRYTVAQISRYVSAIANGGYLNDMTLIKRNNDGSYKGKEIQLNDGDNLTSIQEGMNMVAHNPKGSMYATFNNFPIQTAGKTGTAQKSGLIPSENEIEYLTSNLNEIVQDANQSNEREDIVLTPIDLEHKTVEILIKRNKTITKLTEAIAIEDDIKIKNDLIKQLEKLTRSSFLSEGNAMKAALLELGNGIITNENINKFRNEYDPFAWVASYAPFDKPEIAVVVLIPQGGHSYYAAPLVRDIYAYYFNVER